MHTTQAHAMPSEHNFTLTPVLNEILAALRELLAGGGRHSIDLRGLPFAPGERDRLVEFLGQGEISARLDSLGRSEFIETRFSGVWRIEHYNADEQMIGDLIEIAEVPQLLLPPVDDLNDSASALNTAIIKAMTAENEPSKTLKT